MRLTLVIRHQLDGELAEEEGGHIGYHVVAPWRRHGHATRMLAAGLEQCAALGMTRALLCCDPDNAASQRVILANAAFPLGGATAKDRYWIELK
ncbi:GNAT family N-acetyltransferase [uncultured Jatrophihabitans sp.]|uniref:GNAT family N-acetyltransferase n=1 Tax=uncultured Jatrophihabitans sp. TaxID=1610747 RepID=UPI0035C9D76C